MTETSTTTETEASLGVVRGLYDAAVRGDFEAVLGSLSDDFVLHEPPFLPYGGIYHGREGFAELIGKATSVLDVANMTIDRFVADGEWVIGIIRMPLLDGGEEILLAEESRIRDGQVCEIKVYFHEARHLPKAPKL